MLGNIFGQQMFFQNHKAYQIEGSQDAVLDSPPASQNGQFHENFFFLQFCCQFVVISRTYILFQSYSFVSLAVFPWVSGHMLVKPSGPPDSISLFSRLFRERLSSGSARSCLRLHLTSLTGIPVWTFSRFLVEQSFRQVECFSLPWSAARGSPG